MLEVHARWDRVEQLEMRPRFLGVEVVVGRRGQRARANSAATSALDDAIGVVEVIRYIVVPETQGQTQC